jgi:hypothetical protein
MLASNFGFFDSCIPFYVESGSRNGTGMQYGSSSTRAKSGGYCGSCSTTLITAHHITGVSSINALQIPIGGLGRMFEWQDVRKDIRVQVWVGILVPVFKLGGPIRFI